MGEAGRDGTGRKTTITLCKKSDFLNKKTSTFMLGMNCITAVSNREFLVLRLGGICLRAENLKGVLMDGND